MENETDFKQVDSDSVNHPESSLPVNNNTVEEEIQINADKDKDIEKEGQKPSDTKTDIENKAQFEVPEQYKNEDGSVNVELLLKNNDSYLKEKEELQAKAQLAEQLQNEREQFARSLGFRDYNTLLAHQKEQNTTIEQAQFEAGQYGNFLHTVSNADDVRSLLIQYAQAPTPYLLKQIEAEVDSDGKKEVARNVAEFKLTKEFEAYQNEAREFITDAVTRHKDMFQDSAFKELFKESIKFAGNRFSSDELVRIVRAIGENAVQRYIKEQNLIKENNKITNILTNNAPDTKLQNQASMVVSLLDMDESDLNIIKEKNI